MACLAFLGSHEHLWSTHDGQGRLPRFSPLATMSARQRLQAALERTHPGLTDGLCPGASEAQIDAFGAALGVRLPEDLRAYFAAFNCPDWVLLGEVSSRCFYVSSLAQATSDWEVFRPAGVRVPIAHSGGGDHLCYDLRDGQIVSVFADDDRPQPFCASLSVLLDDFLARVARGEIVPDGAGLSFAADSPDS
jgi:cell wall assembly regulator SMI1